MARAAWERVTDAECSSVSVHGQQVEGMQAGSKDGFRDLLYEQADDEARGEHD